jgi:hypothetical protein
MIKNIRVDLTEHEYDILKQIINEFEYKENSKVYISMKEKIEKPKIIPWSIKKSAAAQKATEKRTKTAKIKIMNAVHLLKFQNKKITYYSIAKTGKVNYQTVKKYISDDFLEKYNK